MVKGKITKTTPRAVRFFAYVDKIKPGELVTRKDMEIRMEAAYSTATYNLDRAVSEGWLNRQWGYASENQPGWLYGLPETLPRLGGM